jgi:predicted nucleic acid-binding protein
LPTSLGLLIADSSPLIALAKLSLLSLPSQLFGRVAMPNVVYQECISQDQLPDAQAIKAAVANGVLEVRADVAWQNLSQRPRLDDGEIAAIAMALESRASLLMDELRGRRVAMQLGVPVVGICGVLLAAKQRGLLQTLPPKFELLRKSGYFISPSLQHSVLIAAGERST